MAPAREGSLSNGHYYHIYTRSIAKFKVFNNKSEYTRMLELMSLCRFMDFNYRFSKFKSLSIETQLEINQMVEESSDRLVDIVAYCIMPTHLHLILRQMSDDGIALFMGKVLDSYSKFFNISHNRTGPLWTSRFKDVQVKDDSQLLHLTRYIHLNPTSAGLVEDPEDWIFSSYREYIENSDTTKHICDFGELFDLSPPQYKKFVSDRQAYQRELSVIKSMLIDDYTG